LQQKAVRAIFRPGNKNLFLRADRA